MSRPDYASPKRQGFYKKRVTLTDAQIKALPTTLVEIIAAPGTGKLIVPFYTLIVVDSQAGGYTNVTATTPFPAHAALYMVWGPSNANASGYLSAALMLETTSVVFGELTIPGNATDPSAQLTGQRIGDLVDAENQNLQLNALNDAGNYTGGNAANKLSIVVYYDILVL